MYNVAWHNNLGDKTTASAATIIGILAAFLDFESVLDVGCGDGRWLAVCREKGATAIAGVDGPWTDKTRLLIPAETFTTQDLSQPLDLERRFSLAISLEVAEHLDTQASDVLVDNLVRHSDVVLFSAAIPYQGGYRHVNEQWQSFWASRFESRGFATFDPVRNLIWNDENVHYWYKQNILLYVNRANETAMSQVARLIDEKNIQQLPTDIVHPEKFTSVASYRQIDFRPLARELPRHTLRNLKSLVSRRR
jgi:SAM-dependent methyltransferase